MTGPTSAGQPSYVGITAQAGGTVSIQHPWPGQAVTVTRVGSGPVTPNITSNVITFPTAAGATYTPTSP